MTEPAADATASSLLDSFGARARRRAEPRASIAIAGAGCALAILGVLIVAGDTGSSGGDDFNRVPGIVLAALVVGAGYLTMSAARQGPIATAGAVAVAAGVPPLMFFLTFDENGFPPYSTEGILGVSTLVWLVTYVAGPGRGRPLFLGAGLIGLWFTILQLTEKVFEAPFLPFVFFGAMTVTPTFDESTEVTGGDDLGSPDFGADLTGDAPFHMPDLTTMALISLGLGLAYLLATRWLDRRARPGAATPFAFATLPTLVVGTLLLVDELEQAGTGLFTMAIGLGLAYHGSTTGRRTTAWVGGTATALGAAVFLSDMTDDATIGGMLFIAAGIGLVAAGHALVTVLQEPDEMEPSELIGVGQRPVTVVAAPTEAGRRPDLPPPPPDAPPSDESPWAPPPPDDDPTA